MSDHEEFMEGFFDASGLGRETGEAAYKSWLAHQGYTEIERIDLESGAYQAGLEAGHAWVEWMHSD